MDFVDLRFETSHVSLFCVQAFTSATAQLYASSFFKAKAQASSQFLQALTPYLGGRPAKFENMVCGSSYHGWLHLDHCFVTVECEPPSLGNFQLAWFTGYFGWQVYDYVAVQSIHNATFAAQIPPTFVEQARDLANWHEYHVFSSPNPKSVGTSAYRARLHCTERWQPISVAVRTLVPSFTEYINRIVNSSDPLKFAYTTSSYKPFVSFFNVTGVAQMNNTLAGVGEYLLFF